MKPLRLLLLLDMANLVKAIDSPPRNRLAAYRSIERDQHGAAIKADRSIAKRSAHPKPSPLAPGLMRGKLQPRPASANPHEVIIKRGAAPVALPHDPAYTGSAAGGLGGLTKRKVSPDSRISTTNV